MSHQAVKWALSTETPSLAARVVLLVLAHHHSHTTGRCDPSLLTIAKEAQVAPRTVDRAIDALEQAWLIMRHSGDRKTSNSYVLVMSSRGTTPPRGTGTTPVGGTGDTTVPAEDDGYRHPRQEVPASTTGGTGIDDKG